MNSSESAPPFISSSSVPPPVPPGVQPEPIQGVIGVVEALLREPARVRWQLGQPSQGRLLGALIAIATLCGGVYGVVVGAFSGGVQYWAAPLKIALGMLASGVICLPSLYIFSCLTGSRARLAEVAGLLVGLLALTTILLLGFAPVAWVFSQSTQSVAGMGALYLIFWIIATWFGGRFLMAGFSNNKAAGSVISIWMVIFVLVCLQMTTTLRPIVGTAPTLLTAEKKFFVAHWGDCLEEKSR